MAPAESNPPDLTAIIPTHNAPPERLRRVLAALQAQEGGCLRQILVVDNASEPPVALPAESGPVPVELLLEPQLGSTQARLRGIAAAASPALVCVDDDNVLAPDYCRAAAAFLAAYPEVGAVGGAIQPEFPFPPPPWMLARVDALACRAGGGTVRISQWHRPPQRREYPWFAPYGAGLVLRSEHVRRYAAWLRGAEHAFAGRVGDQLTGCEDCEMLVRGVFAGGGEVAYSPELALTHVISPGRMNFGYFSKLLYAGARSWAKFRVEYGWESPIATSGWLGRVLLGLCRHRVWTASGYLDWRKAAGYARGRAESRRGPAASPNA